ncbi:cytochrome P450 [Aspergillus karnatakaensis]|uniref:cytochrome P450 n=1 Tax=Aspergillus karnatakaensis TaxID=1810916 RepID=UPI003CCE4C59
MPSYTIISALSITVLLPLYRFLLRPLFLTPLSKIPSAHFTSALSGRWIKAIRTAGNEVRTVHALHRKHGPVVRLAPNELSVNSLHGLRVIYTGAFEKHPLYRDLFLNFHTDNLVGMVPNAPHARQKRMLSRVYSKSYLQESQDLRDLSAVIVSQRLLPLLQRFATTGETANVLPLFQAVGMDFTSSYLFGTRNGTKYLFNLPRWQQWLGEYEKFKHLSLDERADGFVERWCLELCQRTHTEGLGEGMNEPEIETEAVVYNSLRQGLEKSPDDRPIELAIASELLDHLIAGHETSGITFTYIMWELSQRPAFQGQLRRELLTLQPNLKYPFAPGEKGALPDLPHPADIDALPLLDAIVRETLRLHAPAPSPLPRVTPDSTSGTSIDGYSNIPGGITVSSSAYSLHRIEEVYPEPGQWLPQRWLNPEPGKKHDMRRLWWPFGSGGRMCLGSNFALQEIKLVMAAVYTNYTTSIVDDEDIEQDLADFISLPKGRKLMLRFSPVIRT